MAPADWFHRLAGRANSAQVVEIEGTGHVVQHNRAVEVAGSILTFAGLAASGREAPQGFSTWSSVFQIAGWWARDYVYAAGRQLRSAASRVSPQEFLGGTGRPVVVIPGIYEDWRFMLPLIRELNDAGHPVHVVTVLQRNRLQVPGRQPSLPSTSAATISGTPWSWPTARAD